ncbi:hypothetical protein, partial [Acidithiobacillus ferridurans]|uniref:hypothetical protein n=1 Tax=Acidithiobacillus ferridurans TaxID=1232575 RepID=UPI001C077892
PPALTEEHAFSPLVDNGNACQADQRHTNSTHSSITAGSERRRSSSGGSTSAARGEGSPGKNQGTDAGSN